MAPSRKRKGWKAADRLGPVEAPADLRARVALACSILGTSRAAFVRTAVDREADRVLFRRPGAWLWLRPGAAVYRLRSSSDGALVPELLARAAGGERVWPLDRVDDLPEGLRPAEDAGGPQWTQGYLADVSPAGGAEGSEGLSLRRVLVLLGDVMPRRPLVLTKRRRRAVSVKSIPPEHAAGEMPGVRRTLRVPEARPDALRDAWPSAPAGEPEWGGPL